MPYSTPTDVRSIIHTGLTDSDIAAVIEICDAQIDKRLGAQSTTDKVIKKLSMLLAARTIKGRGVSFMENQAGWHHKVPSAEQLEKALEELDSKRINYDGDHSM